ncbi:hypothetical protein L2E82_35658 [Cichorium intybus]|uniref:Uncharacterized protein n=1 Tax=Cichorium intybus TaxID=13427 RepID=A0ACB9BPE4_CICIN|nr:hypothetical protein L2E82_35658 [Cichorium intybus]
MEIGVGEYEIDVDRLRFRHPIAWLVLFGDISSPKIVAALLSSPYTPVSRSSSTSPTSLVLAISFYSFSLPQRWHIRIRNNNTFPVTRLMEPIEEMGLEMVSVVKQHKSQGGLDIDSLFYKGELLSGLHDTKRFLKLLKETSWAVF